MGLLRAGVIVSFERDTYLADVQVIGYVSSYLRDVPVAFHVRPDLVAVGTACVVLFFDELDPTDGMVLAVYGGVPPYDPKFDPVVGHKHRGIVDDGPLL